MHDSQNKRHTESKEERRRKLCRLLSDTVTLYFLGLARSPERPLDPSPRTFVNNHIHSPVHSLIYTADSYRAAQGVEEERAAFKISQRHLALV